jgi:hypothetical protein
VPQSKITAIELPILGAATMGFSASRIVAIAATTASVLALGAGPVIAQSADAKKQPAIALAWGIGMTQAGTGHRKWHVEVQNSEHGLFFSSDQQRARAVKKALHKCRMSRFTREPKSCHVYAVYQKTNGGDGGLVPVEPSGGIPAGPGRPPAHAVVESRAAPPQ